MRTPALLLPLFVVVGAESIDSLQAGDAPGEVQGALPEDLELPDPAPRSPEEERASFQLAPGYSIELVAAEPLVVDPVVARFDAGGRLWVVEMRGYMPDVDGGNEDAPVGRIAVLRDTDGDGRMDTRVDFLDGLVLPRGVAPWRDALGRDGALVLAPPDLLYCVDTDGDGRADERTVVDTGLAGLASPEHAPNGLLYTLDNWFQCANHDRRYREEGGRWRVQRTSGGGQWGLSRDDWGRVVYNTNSDPLRADLVSAYESARNPNHGPVAGWNVGLDADRTTWPARPTPGVNRGYRPETLREDLTLRSVTAACAPWVYRGDALADCVDDAFVCEPAGNLVKRYSIDWSGETPRVQPQADPREFLTSSDERFRPVDLTEGPDGALYVVDLYRGILQHRVFLTTFLREQIVARGLDEPVGLGRIWRVVPEEPRATAARPDFASANWDDLAEALAHTDGWVRDTARRMFVEEGRGSADARAALRDFAPLTGSAVGLVNALWALEGLGETFERAADAELRRRALTHTDVEVRRNALRLFARSAQLEELERVGADPLLRQQWLLSLGERPVEEVASTFRRALAADASRPEDRSAVLSGLGGFELEFLTGLGTDPAWTESAPGRETFVALLGRAIVRAGRAERIAEALRIADELPPERAWLASALRAAIERERGPLREVRPLDEIDQLAFDDGREVFATVCATCHGADGRGEPGKGPPLRRSPWILGDDERLILILRDGLTGPIDVAGERWSMEMPAWRATDEEVSSVLTYLRREWGHGADPVSVERVREVRTSHPRRGSPWTVEELPGG